MQFTELRAITDSVAYNNGVYDNGKSFWYQNNCQATETDLNLKPGSASIKLRRCLELECKIEGKKLKAIAK
jgi:hypothetical protein